MKKLSAATAKMKPVATKKRISKVKTAIEEVSDAEVANPILYSAQGIGVADEIVVDLSTSCTKDVAVAKLLGWMRGPIRRRYIEVTADGIAIDQMPYLHTLEVPLADRLAEFRATAHRKLFEAFEANAAEDVMDALDLEVRRCHELIYKAAQFLRDIEDELGKGDKSALAIDQTATLQAGVAHITLSSLDRWSRTKYNIGIAEDYSGNCSKGPKDGSRPEPVEKTFDEELLTPGLETAYASFGFLMASYVAKHKAYMFGEKISSESLAGAVILEIQKGTQLDSQQGTDVEIRGQAIENMRKTFARAVRAMEDKLRMCKTNQIDYLKSVEK